MTEREALAVLSSASCACGAVKKAAMAFCRRCYYALPEARRKALWKRVGHGFEAAYGEAKQVVMGKVERCVG